MGIQRRPGQSTRVAGLPGRHFDDGRSLGAYADRIAVSCHRCGAAGWVTASWQPYQWSARFRCSACSAAVDSSQGRWLGAVRYVGRRPCGYCGYQWVHVSKTVPAMDNLSPPATLAGTCAYCQRSCEVSVTCQQVRDDRPADPHFGLPLRLVLATRAGVVWAYNEAHLAALHAFTVAGLREGRGVHYSMFSRLPTWMKQARHRHRLQQAIERLQRQLQDQSRGG